MWSDAQYHVCLSDDPMQWLQSESISIVIDSPQLMVSNDFQKVSVFYLEGTKYEKVNWAFNQLTLLVTYNDGLCSLFYTTNLLKDGCLASIGSSHDKNAKMATSILLPEHCNILHICNCKELVKFIFWWRERDKTHQVQLPQQSLPSPILLLVRTRNGIYIWNVDHKGNARDSLSRWQDKSPDKRFSCGSFSQRVEGVKRQWWVLASQ